MRKITATAETIEGRLSMLEDAAKVERLASAAHQLTLELLLLGGRTEEAELLLGVMDKPRSLPYIHERLSITHGSDNIPETKDEETVPGISEMGISALRSSQAETPEAYASRRGMLINTGLLFSPYDDMPIQPAASEKETASYTESVVSIQVGAFSRRENADQHLTFLKSRGISARLLEEKRTDGRTVYKTIIPVSDDQNAQTELIRLKEIGIEGFILY